MSTGPHTSRVRILYKAILRLHRGLPNQIREFGDEYVRSEFKRHRAADQQFVGVFMKEWTNYAVTLAKQLGKKTSYESLGVRLSEEKLGNFSEQQIGQLYELFEGIQSASGAKHGGSSLLQDVNSSGHTLGNASQDQQTPNQLPDHKSYRLMSTQAWNFGQCSPLFPAQVGLLNRSGTRLFSTTPIDPEHGRLVYVGPLTKQVKIVKGFSVSTSAFGLLMQPFLYQSASSLPPALAVAISGMVGFFIFVTPLLLHFVTRRYVTQIHYRPESDQFTASTLTFFLRTHRLTYRATDVGTYDIPRMFATLRVKDTPLFVDPSQFTDRAAGVRMLRYDEPLDWELPEKPDGKKS